MCYTLILGLIVSFSLTISFVEIHANGDKSHFANSGRSLCLTFVRSLSAAGERARSRAEAVLALFSGIVAAAERPSPRQLYMSAARLGGGAATYRPGGALCRRRRCSRRAGSLQSGSCSGSIFRLELGNNRD